MMMIKKRLTIILIMISMVMMVASEITYAKPPVVKSIVSLIKRTKI